MLRLAIASTALLVSGAVFAADLPSRKMEPAAPASAACLERNALPTDVFGFNVGSDVNDAGALSASVTYNGAYGTRFGNYAGHTVTGQISYGFGPCFEVGPYILGTWANNSGALGAGTGNAFGGGVEFKYKALGRDTHGVGLTFDLLLQGQGLSGNFYAPTGSMYDAIASVFIDKELIAGKLYGAVNLSYDFNWRNQVLPGDFTNTSVLRIGGALSWQLVDGFFIGADVNHYRRYDSSFFGAELGYATYVGPNFYWQATPKLAVTAAWNIQVAGKTTGFGGVPGRIDLVNFNQNLLKLKAAYSF